MVSLCGTGLHWMSGVKSTEVKNGAKTKMGSRDFLWYAMFVSINRRLNRQPPTVKLSAMEQATSRVVRRTQTRISILKRGSQAFKDISVASVSSGVIPVRLSLPLAQFGRQWDVIMSQSDLSYADVFFSFGCSFSDVHSSCSLPRC